MNQKNGHGPQHMMVIGNEMMVQLRVEALRVGMTPDELVKAGILIALTMVRGNQPYALVNGEYAPVELKR